MIVRAGKGMLEMVLQNILENAISFSPRGSTIAVTLSKGRDTVELRVEDEGPGISPERIDYIFDRYFSARPTSKTAPSRRIRAWASGSSGATSRRWVAR